jgi:hypothetical protein
MALPVGLICAAYCERSWKGLNLRQENAHAYVEPGLGASLCWEFELTTGRQMRIFWRELQPDFSEIWLEHLNHFEPMDLEAAGDEIGVQTSDLIRVGGQLKWRDD